jgi:hypothetical protein
MSLKRISLERISPLELEETKDKPVKILPGGKVANKSDWLAYHVSASESCGI